MTEEQYQAARKIMQQANHARGMITIHKGHVAKWSNIEDSHRKNLQPGKADSAKKMLDRAMADLDKAKAKFAEMKFPDETAGTKTKWIAALCSDSFKYLPKEIKESQFLEANSEGHTMWDTKPAAQKECNALNSQ